MRLRATSLASTSARPAAIARERYREQTRREVRHRWLVDNQGRCEGCEQRVEIVEVAHLVGRGSKADLPEPWASSPELCAALCCARSWGFQRAGCHEKIDRALDPLLRYALLCQAAEHLARRLSVGWRQLRAIWHAQGEHDGELCDDALNVIRELIRYAEANGIEP